MKIFQKYLLICITLTVSMLEGCPHDKDSITNIETPEALHNLLTKSQGPIIISLFMDGCHYCEKMKPIINDLATEPRFTNICFFHADKLNDRDTKQAISQDIPGYPFFLFMDQGKYITKQIGESTKEEFIHKIETAFPNAINNNLGDHSCGCGCNHNHQ